MTVLFIIRNHGYLRIYESTLRMLAERGHRVVLVSRGAERHHAADTKTFVEQLCATYPAISVHRWPSRADAWTPLAEAARSLRTYARFLRPRFRATHKIRARAAEKARQRGASRLPRNPVTGWIAETSALLAEHAIPPDPAIVARIADVAPDVVVASPLVDFNSYQVDYVLAAQALGIPTVWAVASWDNLSNKSLTPVVPDRVLVWNETQRTEATELQAVPRERVRVTGAQVFDVWFTQRPSTSRAEFCAEVGLPDRPFLLYLCSSIFIAPEETAFVRRWLERLRESSHPELRQCGVLIRPYPGIASPWATVNLDALGPVAIWPRAGDLPIAEEAKRDYFDSLWHSAGVAGINTSGMIEAGIVGRRSFTLLAPEFAHTQQGTVHFRYLTDYGFVVPAHSWEEHLGHLAAVLRGEMSYDEESRQRVLTFVSPRDQAGPNTPRVVEAIEDASQLPREVSRPRRRSALALKLALFAMTPWLGKIAVPDAAAGRDGARV